MRNFRSAWTAGLLALLAGVADAAPQVLHTVHGDGYNDELGPCLAPAGDFDDDGHPDWIVGAPDSDQNGFQAGYARVYSGDDGSVLATIFGTSPGRMGYSVAGVGDWNQDGHDDVAVGAPYTAVAGGPIGGLAQVISGADQSVLFSVQGSGNDRLGWSVAGAGDVNDDGFVDLIVGAPYESHVLSGGDGGVHVFSGADGSELFSFEGAVDGLVGWSVAGIGDVDGDDHDDVLVGEPWASRVVVLSGFDGSVLRTHGGGYLFGYALAAVPNLDGDAIPDYAIGSPYDSTTLHWAGSVRLVAGADGSPIDTLYGAEADQWMGWSLAGAGDLDLDGTDDVLVGSPAYGSNDRGLLRVHSGADRSTLWEFTGSSNQQLGKATAGLGDLDGDGLPDFAVSLPHTLVSGLNYAGRVDVWSGASGPLHWDTFCAGQSCPCGNDGTNAGCLNSTGLGAGMFVTGSTSVGADDLVFQVNPIPAGKVALLFDGTGQVGGGVGAPFGDGVRCVSGNIERLIAGTSPSTVTSWGPGLGALGTWSAGDTRYFQLWYRDPAGPCGSGFNLSSGAVVQFLP